MLSESSESDTHIYARNCPYRTLRATRGINGTNATENAHVEVQDIAADEAASESINLPAPAQANVDHEAKAAIQGEAAAARDVVTGEEGQDVEVDAVTETEVAPGELEHEEKVSTPVMSRSETADSVQIICNLLA